MKHIDSSGIEFLLNKYKRLIKDVILLVDIS